MGSYLESGEFWDIIISVDGKEFKCHRFILAVHSEYFKTCFTTKENDNKKYHSLEGITSEVFELVLKAMYTRCKIVNEDNVFETLKAATYLKISYMENECTELITKLLSLENCISFYTRGALINSEKMNSIVWPFILKNFCALYCTDYFLHFSKGDILKLVQSQDLETKSEDNVVDAILFWINNRTFENAETDIMPVNQIEARDDGVSTLTDQPALKRRKVDSELNRDILADEEFLVKLFTHVKLSLVSQKCLEKLTEHSLVQGNCKLSHLIIKAFSYHAFIDKREVNWLPDATHRKHSEYRHSVLLVIQNKKNTFVIKEHHITNKTWNSFLLNNSITTTLKLVANDASLYAFCKSNLAKVDTQMEDSQTNGISKRNMHIYISQYLDGKWLNVNKFVVSAKTFSVVTVNKFIYILCPVGRKVLKLDTFSRKLEIMEELPNSNPISYATHYHDKIIVFYSQPVKDLDMIDTKIYCYDIQGKKWSPIPINESYTPNGMTSFKDELNTYIIQSCGEILKIVDSSTGSIHFEHVRKLWHIDWKLHGAVIVMNELYIYGVTSTDHSASLKVEEGVLGFDKIHYIYKNNNTDNSTFAPFILKNVGDTTLSM